METEKACKRFERMSGGGRVDKGLIRSVRVRMYALLSLVTVIVFSFLSHFYCFICRVFNIAPVA